VCNDVTLCYKEANVDTFFGMCVRCILLLCLNNESQVFENKLCLQVRGM